MSDRDPLDGFRGAAGDLDGERDARLRARLAELTAGQRDRDGEHPFGDEPALVAPLRPRAGRRSPQAWRWVAAAAAALVLAATGAGAVALRSDHQRDDVLAGVGDGDLGAVSARAAQQPPVALGPGLALYQRWQQGRPLDLGGRAGTVTVDGETWVAADGTGREVRTDEVFTATRTGEATIQAPGATVAYPVPGGLAVDAWSPADVATLPVDPDRLAAVAADALALGDDPGRRFEAVARLLMVSVVPPEVRAAAFLALGVLGGEAVGEVRDRAGRPGVGYAGPGPGGGVALVVVDPVTTAVAEVRAGPGPDAPTPDQATSWRTVLEQRVVAAPG